MIQLYEIILQRNSYMSVNASRISSSQNISFDEQAFIRFIGKNIKTYRMRSDLTQDQLANEVGIARVSLARIEAGTANTTIKTLVRLAHALKVSPDVFFNAADTIHISKKQVMQEGLQHLMERIVYD